MNIYKIKYVVLAKSWPESEHETKHHCELTVAADDVESAIKRVREESKHQVVRITDAPYVAAVDLWPNDPSSPTRPDRGGERKGEQ